MRVEIIEPDSMEIEQTEIGKTRIIARGVYNIPKKSKGGPARFNVNTGLTKGVRSGRMKKMMFDKKLKSWQNFVEKKISMTEMQILQAQGK